ncbi:MAG TPA: hypothetical protein VH395_15620 [Jatrophihabitantaceae bacterium]
MTKTWKLGDVSKPDECLGHGRGKITMTPDWTSTFEGGYPDGEGMATPRMGGLRPAVVAEAGVHDRQ